MHYFQKSAKKIKSKVIQKKDIFSFCLFGVSLRYESLEKIYSSVIKKKL